MKLDFMVKKTNGDKVLPLGMGDIEICKYDDWENLCDVINELVDTLKWDKDDTLSLDLRVGVLADNYDEDEMDEVISPTYDEDDYNEADYSMWDEYESDDEDEATYYEPSQRVHDICAEIGDLICDLFLDD